MRNIQKRLGVLYLKRLAYNWKQRSRPEARTELLELGLSQQRVSRLLTGLGIVGGVILSYLTPWGYCVLLAMAIHLMQFAFTGRCKINQLADRLAIPYERPPEHLVVDLKHG